MEKPGRLSRARRWLGKALHRWLPRPDANNAPARTLANTPGNTPASTTQRGHAAETRALHHLQAAGLELLARNWRSPGRGGGEIDLIMRAPDGSLVFVEVRSRRQSGFGGAAGSIGADKQRRIVRAARHWLLRHGLAHAPCRFDVVLIEGGALHWHQGAFDAPPA